LLWPTDNLPAVGDEVDFPEGEWDSTFCVHVHSLLENDGRAVANFCPDIGWADWNTTEIDWSPGSLKFYLNGKLVGSLTGKWAPTTPMSWILQNEGALYGPEAAENSSAQINISSVAVYSYQGGR
jgi:beta-glucanase (GH16 family)